MPKFYEQNTYKDPHQEGSVSRFSQKEFKTTIDELGYDVIWTPAICAPKRQDEQDISLNDKNTGGLEYFWVNPVEIRAIITSIDIQKAHEQDGIKDLSMIEVTVKHEFRLSYMDRIIIKNATISHSENLRTFKLDSGSWAAYSTYPIQKVYGMFKKESDIQKYTLLTEGTDYTVDHNEIRFDSSFDLEDEMLVAVRYEGNPVYYMDTINHVSRVSKLGTFESIELPVQGTARLAHKILELENFDGDLYLSNDFDISCSLGQPETGKDVFYRTLRYTPTQEIYDNLSTNQKAEMAVIASP